jgi:hypothetical protein
MIILSANLLILAQELLLLPQVVHASIIHK